MKKICLIVALMFSTVALADDIDPMASIPLADGPVSTPLLKVEGLNIQGTINTDAPVDFTFMDVRVTDHGKVANEKFFIGPLPEPGQAVEMIYIGPGDNGSMKFQLRVKQP